MSSRARASHQPVSLRTRLLNLIHLRHYIKPTVLRPHLRWIRLEPLEPRELLSGSALESVDVGLSPQIDPALVGPNGYWGTFAWNRSSDWTPGTTPGSTAGNPDDDAKGNAAWRYGYVTGGDGVSGAHPWYAQPETLLVWDDNWFGQLKLKTAGVYQDDFYRWNRYQEWTPGTTVGSTAGNPDDDHHYGRPTWRYEYVTADNTQGLTSATPWYKNSASLLQWDNNFGGAAGRPLLDAEAWSAELARLLEFEQITARKPTLKKDGPMRAAVEEILAGVWP